MGTELGKPSTARWNFELQRLTHGRAVWYVAAVWSYAFSSGCARLTSDSSLHFWERSEVEASLHIAGFALDEVREALDRPGRKLVFLARRRR